MHFLVFEECFKHFRAVSLLSEVFTGADQEETSFGALDGEDGLYKSPGQDPMVDFERRDAAAAAVPEAATARAHAERVFLQNNGI